MKNKDDNNKTFGEWSKKLYNAYKKGKIIEEINIAEKMGYHLFAASRAREFGLYKKAKENYEKTNEGIPNNFRDILQSKKALKLKDIKNYQKMRNTNECEERLKLFEKSQEQDYFYQSQIIKISN